MLGILYIGAATSQKCLSQSQNDHTDKFDHETYQNAHDGIKSAKDVENEMSFIGAI